MLVYTAPKPRKTTYLTSAENLEGKRQLRKTELDGKILLNWTCSYGGKYEDDCLLCFCAV
jgi:hypothetical protein